LVPRAISDADILKNSCRSNSYTKSGLGFKIL
jgi:hypothetical protein